MFIMAVCKYERILFRIIIMAGILMLIGCERKGESGERSIEVQKNNVQQYIDKYKDFLLETEKVKSSDYRDDSEGLVIEILNQDTVEAKVDGQEAYEKFIGQLSEYKKYTVLYLDLLGKDTIIYLDEILSHANFTSLSISNGGIISIKELESFSDNLLENLEFHHIIQVKDFEIKRCTALKSITVWLDGHFEITEGITQIINNVSCENIIVLWDDENQFWNLDFLEEYDACLKDIYGWGSFMKDIGKERYFEALYKLNNQHFSYASCEFYNRELKLEPHIAISVGNEENNYFDILEIPPEMLSEISRLDGQRIRLEDINFDGYKDIIFLGYNDGLEVYHECIGFLWNQSEGRFVLNKTVPVYFDYIDNEKKRLVYTSSSSAFDDTYCIYEYINGAFEEKKLYVTFRLNESDLEEIIWEYYENGVLVKKLILNDSEDGEGHYVFYDRNGSTVKGILSKGKMYSELGKEYFPEFDFYNHG